MMTFEQFQATRKWSENLVHEPDLDLGFDEKEVLQGYLYEGGLHIFVHGGGAAALALELVIGNEQTIRAELAPGEEFDRAREELERKLYAFGLSEGMFE